MGYVILVIVQLSRPLAMKEHLSVSLQSQRELDV